MNRSVPASQGLPVTLVSDAHTTHDKAHLSAKQIITHHNATLPSIQSLGAPIKAVPTETLWPHHAPDAAEVGA